MPFTLWVGSNANPKQNAANAQREAKEKKAYEIQSLYQKWFAEKEYKYTITIQKARKTDSLLRKANIGYADLYGIDKAALCKYLGVDGVMFGSITMSNPDYDFGTDLGLNAATAIATNSSFAVGQSANNVTNSMFIYDTTGQVIWQYKSKQWGPTNNSATLLANNYFEVVSREFPFRKRKKNN
ncbi:hypothetical protein [Parasediminibacterium sp. JCM 36343]|uniref:hypothetical protein n=1 Tax=Parasediminibacterium sp. JCM 36343 TaxID=3374279 RepID=UPI0039785B8C